MGWQSKGLFGKGFDGYTPFKRGLRWAKGVIPCPAYERAPSPEPEQEDSDLSEDDSEYFSKVEWMLRPRRSTRERRFTTFYNPSYVPGRAPRKICARKKKSVRSFILLSRKQLAKRIARPEVPDALLTRPPRKRLAVKQKRVRSLIVPLEFFAGEPVGGMEGLDFTAPPN